jgi:hypothetical protein
MRFAFDLGNSGFERIAFVVLYGNRRNAFYFKLNKYEVRSFRSLSGRFG